MRWRNSESCNNWPKVIVPMLTPSQTARENGCMLILKRMQTICLSPKETIFTVPLCRGSSFPPSLFLFFCLSPSSLFPFPLLSLLLHYLMQADNADSVNPRKSSRWQQKMPWSHKGLPLWCTVLYTSMVDRSFCGCCLFCFACRFFPLYNFKMQAMSSQDDVVQRFPLAFRWNSCHFPFPTII